MASKGQTRVTAAPLLVILAVTALLYGVIALNGWGYHPKLGLDLQGGTSVILTPKPVTGGGTPTKASINKAVDIIRQRVNVTGVTESEVTREDTNILVSIPGGDKQQLAQIDKTAQLRFRMVQNVASGSSTPQPAPSAVPGASASPAPSASGGATASPSAGSSSASPAASPASSPASSPAAGAGTPAPTASPSGNGRALTAGLVRQTSASATAAPTASPLASAPSTATASPAPASSASAVPSAEPSASVDPNAQDQNAPDPNAANPAAAADPTALATFAALDCLSDDPKAVAFRQKAADSDADETKSIATCSEDHTEKLLLGPAEMTGRDVRGAVASIPQTDWIVTLQLNGGGRKKFTKLTSANVGKQFAIVLDGLVVSHPTIREAIPGDATISGSFTKKDANNLANVLKFGALPVSFVRGDTEQISPTLGKKSLHAGLVAGFLGLGIVVLYVLAYYRGLGMVTVLGLLLFAALNYALVVILGHTIGFTLTEAGIAGLIVSVGITADSYVVFYERLKDEVRDGRSLRGSVDRGFARAWRTILAADAVSFLAAAILYILSIGAVRGFAFTLGLSTILDVTIAWMFTRPMVTLLTRTKLFSEGRFVGIRAAVPIAAPIRATRMPKEA